MISFDCVVTDRSAEIFKVSARPSFLTALLGIRATSFSIELAQHFCAPPVVQTLNSLLEFTNVGDGIFALIIHVETLAQLVQLRIQIDREEIRNCNIVNVTDSQLRGALGDYMSSQFLFRDLSRICRTACANVPAVISDDPSCLVSEFSAPVSASGFELKSCSLASSRHSSRIRSI
jgi:hypothetical protein